MTRQQAMEYDDKLSKKLQDYASDCGEDKTAAKNIVDNYIEFLPENDIKNMVFLGNDPVSYKLGNVRIDLKKAILAGVELAASVSRPESIFNYIQMLIVSVLFIRSVTRQELNGIEVYIVYLLHIKGAYQSGVEEEQFIHDFQEWYMQRENTTLERRNVVETINHLYEMKVADFENGKICLREKVWGKLE
ncbi:MAG: hypothetical protein K2O91_27060 [Lachnospiraceae bacterium]|nr:hypothetical protein [Lachnospiraceae bacterium]